MPEKDDAGNIIKDGNDIVQTKLVKVRKIYMGICGPRKLWDNATQGEFRFFSSILEIQLNYDSF